MKSKLKLLNPLLNMKIIILKHPLIKDACEEKGGIWVIIKGQLNYSEKTDALRTDKWEPSVGVKLRNVLFKEGLIKCKCADGGRNLSIRCLRRMNQRCLR